MKILSDEKLKFESFKSESISNSTIHNDKIIRQHNELSRLNKKVRELSRELKTLKDTN